MYFRIKSIQIIKKNTNNSSDLNQIFLDTKKRKILVNQKINSQQCILFIFNMYFGLNQIFFFSTYSYFFF